MVFIHGLSPVNRAKDNVRQEKLRQPNKPLDENKDIHHQRHFTMSTLKSSLGVRGFVQFDDYQASNKRYSTLDISWTLLFLARTGNT